MPFDGRPQIRFDAGVRFDYARDYHYRPVERLDDAENAFLDRELRHLMPVAIQREYTALNARIVLPVYFANDPAATHVAWEYSEDTGDAMVGSDFTEDAPASETSTREYESPVTHIRAAARWSIQEVRAAAKANRPIQARKVNTARDRMLRRENTIAWKGHAKTDVPGFFRQPTRPGFVAVPRDNAGQTILAGTAQQNLDELHDFVNAVANESEQIFMADTLCIPPVQYDHLARQKIGTLGDAPSVLKDFLDNNPHIKTVLRVNELATCGPGDTPVLTCFKRDIDVVRLVVAYDIEQFEPERRGMQIRVEYHMITGGTLILQPNACRILEDV